MSVCILVSLSKVEESVAVQEISCHIPGLLDAKCGFPVEGFGRRRAEETLQISHVVLIRCVKECSVCFLAEVCLVFDILHMQKTCILWSRQHISAKTVISLKIKQNIDRL